MPKGNQKGRSKTRSERNGPLKIPLPFEEAVAGLLRVKPLKKKRTSVGKGGRKIPRE